MASFHRTSGGFMPLSRLGFIVLMTSTAVFQTQMSQNINRNIAAIDAMEDLIDDFINQKANEILETALAMPVSFGGESDTMPSYEVDDLCGGCRYSSGPRNKPCGKAVVERSLKENVTLWDAVHFELNHTNEMKSCLLCIQCEDRHKVYWRPDHAAPTIRQATTHYLTSIPEDKHRVPREVLLALDDENLSNLTSFFQQEPNRHPSKRYLFEYNPSIVPFPKGSHQDQHEFTIDGQVPTYISTYRVANVQSCFPPKVTVEMIGGSWETRPRSISYLGIALLDSDLSVMADAVFDLPRTSFGYLEDFRLFSLHQKLYLTSYCKLIPLRIGTEESPPHSKGGNAQTMQPLFHSSTKLLLSTAETFISCSNDRKIKGQGAKNLNYFIDAKTNRTMFELFLASDIQSKVHPHIVHPVNLTLPTKANPEQMYGKHNAFTDRTGTTTATRPGFYTLDELEVARGHNFYESPFVGDRGSACCVEFADPNQTSSVSSQPKLLLGVSHVKIPFGRNKINQAGFTPNQYLSRFYAMEPVAPYRTVARSGYICFSEYASDDTYIMNPLAAWKHHRWPKFSLGELMLDCPAIHFITGMTEKVGDPSTLIIAYGFGDCTSWFVEVDKQEVVDLLFGPPKQISSIKSVRPVS